MKKNTLVVFKESPDGPCSLHSLLHVQIRAGLVEHEYVTIPHTTHATSKPL